MHRLHDKAALITGGGAGIGAATGRIFCQEGAAVVLVDRDSAALEETARSIREQVKGAKVAYCVADVSDADEAVRAVAHGMAQFGRLDILVNNAAMRNYASMAEATHEDWLGMLGVNLIGAANYAKAALPELRRSGAGSIVTVSSCYAVTGRKGMGIYDATKAALLAFTRTLAFEEAAHGVRANAVCPGSTLTTFQVNRGKAAGKTVDQLMQDRKDNSLIGRWGTPEEIAWPILWLASAEASFITGTTLMVDGGLSIM
jgi:meso-butanediol dehydrogenase/(S,S)-butanediol dehydrogenase/diacetyl reductase